MTKEDFSGDRYCKNTYAPAAGLRGGLSTAAAERQKTAPPLPTVDRGLGWAHEAACAVASIAGIIRQKRLCSFKALLAVTDAAQVEPAIAELVLERVPSCPDLSIPWVPELTN